MKLSAKNIYEATLALAQIINRPRALPTLAQYKIARMHRILEAEYKVLEAQRVKLVEELGEEVYSDEEKTTPAGWKIPEGSPKMAEFTMRWNTILGEEVEVNVQPITITALGDTAGGVTAAEFLQLGELVTE